jgi:hypothetical protein
MPEGLEQMPDADFRNLILYILHPPQEQAAKKRSLPPVAASRKSAAKHRSNLEIISGL